MIRVYGVVAGLLWALPTEAAILTVKAAGGGNYTTIQACANAAVAGDTCTVYVGTYSEFVSLPTDGSVGNVITFNVNSGDTVKVNGFTLTNRDYITIGGTTTATSFEIVETSHANQGCIYLNNSTHILIQYNNIHNCSLSQAIRFDATSFSSYVTIAHNTISTPGSELGGAGGAGLIVNGDHTLVDANDISHVTDFLSVYGAANVVRNNTLHDALTGEFSGAPHVDGAESQCSTPLQAASHVVYEGNSLKDNTWSNGHFWLIQDSGCSSAGFIVRYNLAYNLGSAYMVGQTGTVDGIKDYNNTVVKTYLGAKPAFSEFLNLTGNTNAAVLNNLWVDASNVNGGAWAGTPTAANNLWYDTGCTTGCTYANPYNTSTGAIKNTDPLLNNINSNWNLTAASPAINAGAALTTTNGTGTSSTTLIVTDAGFFQDGAGIVNADWICVTTVTNCIQLSAVTYSTNTITLATAISWANGDAVWLSKRSDGSVVLVGSAPDVGAFEYSPTVDPAHGNVINRRILRPGEEDE